MFIYFTAQKITTFSDETLDLFDIITNVVAKLNSQIVYKKAKPKRKFNELLDLYGIPILKLFPPLKPVQNLLTCQI